MPIYTSTLSDITLTCRQCGGTGMERLNRRDYRCTQCGAVTIIGKADADRIERLLQRSWKQPEGAQSVPRPDKRRLVVMFACSAAAVLLGCILVPQLLFDNSRHHSAASTRSSDADRTVPVDQVALTDLQWHADSKTYEGLVSNHSGFPIEVPRYEMTLFANGLKGETTGATTTLDRLMPGEYEPISFRFLQPPANARYEIEKLERVDRSQTPPALLALTDQQWVRQGDNSSYRLVGIVENTLARPVRATEIVAMVYGADRKLLGSGSSYVPDLKPGEKAAADITIYTHDDRSPVAAYEYLVDSQFADRQRDAAAPVPASRIQRVDAPHLRLVPRGLDLSAQDLLDNARQPPAPLFDAQQLLSVKQPRRIRDEQHNTGFLGEVTNTSPDQVVIAPQATVILTRNGKEVDRATHDFPDLVPGAHVPLYFKYDGEPKAFDAMSFVWQPAHSYTLGAPGHPQLAGTVETKELQGGEAVLNGNQLFHYSYVHVTGTIQNKGPGKVGKVRLFVVLRDAKGEMTGYERQDDGGGLDAGQTGKFSVDVVQWGAPATTVEAIPLPVSPPPF